MDTRSEITAYDAFGEPAGRPTFGSTARARTLAVAVFWSVASLLIAGRVYEHAGGATPPAHVMAMAAR